MIIKSLSRKSRSFRAGSRGGLGPIESLARYMNRGIEKEDGKAVLWHNFYGHEKTREDEIIREFQDNAKLLRERSNGNVLYHEILSFSRGHQLKDEALIRAVADIGQEYLNERASRQMAYGVIHRDTDHIHLHLMVSSNAVGKSERVRLSKKEFSEVQKRVERFALERFPELQQTKVYDRERSPEKLKTDASEQAMKTRKKEPSRKETIKGRLHSLFERATSFQELASLSKEGGFSFYQRGKTVGVIVRDPDGTERKHRLSTLGLEVHYEITNRRLSEPEKKPERPTKEPAMERPEPEPARKPTEPVKEKLDTRSPHSEPPALTPLEREMNAILSKIPGMKPPGAPDKAGPERGDAGAPGDRERDDDRDR
jgi:hypothetical protein